MSERYVHRKISRGVHASVELRKRGGAEAQVYLSKKRVAELETLKTSPLFQSLTLIEGRSSKTLFRTKLGSMADAEAWLNSVVAAANAVGIGSALVLVDVKNTQTQKTNV